MQRGNEEAAGMAHGQPAYVLVAWIRDQLADMHGAQGRRLSQLAERLRSGAFTWDHARLAQSIAALHAAGRELRFLDVRHGAFARLLGRHREPQARFLSAFERVRESLLALRQHALDLQAGHADHSAQAKRALIELDMESQSLGGDIDQGVGWLQDLCAQLSAAAAGGGDDPQLAAHAEAAQHYTQEFRRLQSASSIAREIAVRGQNVVQRRSVLLEQAHAIVDVFEEHWLQRVGALVNDVRAGRRSHPGIPKAIESHDELMKRVAATADGCTALQHEEHLAAQQLSMLQEELEGAPR